MRTARAAAQGSGIGAHAERFLLVACGDRACGLPLAHVSEVMRPLPLTPLTGAPPFVLGMTVIRGEAMPVVGASELMRVHAAGTPGAFVALRSTPRSFALAVTQLIGVRDLDKTRFASLDPMIAACDAKYIDGATVLDERLLLLLQTSRLLPPGIAFQ